MSNSSARLALQNWAQKHRTTVTLRTGPNPSFPMFTDTTVSCALFNRVLHVPHQQPNMKAVYEEEAARKFLQMYGKLPTAAANVNRH